MVSQELTNKRFLENQSLDTGRQYGFLNNKGRRFQVIFYPRAIDRDIRIDSLFYAKEFSNDLTGRDHNILVDDIKSKKRVIYKPQGAGKTTEQIVTILKRDFNRIIEDIKVV